MSDKQLALVPEQPQAITPMQMLQQAFEAAIKQGAGLEVVDCILKGQREMMEYQDRVAFNDALARVQAKARRVGANKENPQTHSRYANFAALDSVMRPIYVAEGLSLSFDTADIDKPDMVRVVCDASLGGYTRRYHIDMPADGKGAKGNDVMTRTHATGSAVSYGKRYLLVMIFNLTVGEQDDDGNAASGQQSPAATMSDPEFTEWCDGLRQAPNIAALQEVFVKAYKAAQKIGDKGAMAEFMRIKDAAKRGLA